MKKIYGFLGAAALVALASCSDDVKSPQEGPLDSNSNAKATVCISMGSVGTRATDETGAGYDQGSSDENLVSTLLLVFYDASGNVVGTAAQKDVQESIVTDNEDPNKVSNIVTTVNVDLYDGKTPQDAAQVVAFINWPEGTAVATTPLDELSSVTLAVSGTNLWTNGKFPMTNSGYYSGETYTFATPSIGYVYNANDEGSHSILNIYVERLAAKVSLAKVENAVYDETLKKGIKAYPVVDKAGNAGTLTFVPGNWGVTATSKSEYAVKHMTKDRYKVTTHPWIYPASTSEVTYRSFWAEGVGYEANNNNFPTSSSSVGTNYTLSYSSYSDAKTAVGGSLYVPETTFDASVINGLDNRKAAMTMVLLNGTYTAKAANESSFDGSKYNQGFYLRSTVTGVDSEGTPVRQTTIYTEEEIIASLVAAASAVKVIPTDGEARPLTSEDVEFGALKDDKTKAANAYYIQIDESLESAKFTIYEAGEAKEKSLEDVNKYLVDFVGNARAYIETKAYFAIPIEHYLTSTYGETEEGVQTGNYGVVRNNSYKITVNSITGIGQGATGDAETEIPLPDPEDDNNYGIDVALKVLQWHLRNQSVDL